MLKKLVIAITMVLVMSLAITGVADAKVYYLSLISDATSGTTTVASGTSEMVVNSGVTVIPGLDNFARFDCMVQVRSISGLTVAVGPKFLSGDNSGVSFTLRYKESMIDDQAYWDQATAVNVFNGTLFSGTSLVQVQIYPVGLGFMKWEYVSGITQMGSANFIFKVLD